MCVCDWRVQDLIRIRISVTLGTFAARGEHGERQKLTFKQPKEKLQRVVKHKTLWFPVLHLRFDVFI